MSTRTRLQGLSRDIEQRIEYSPALPPAYRSMLRAASKHVRKADDALRAADMIINGSDCEHGYSRQSGGPPADCPACEVPA